MTKITIGARGSKLSIAYVEKVKELLIQKNNDLKEDSIHFKAIKTSGDIDQNVKLSEIGGKNLFCKEIEEKLLKKEHLIAANVPLDTPIIGTENGKEFTRVIINDEKEMDIDQAKQDHLDAVKELMTSHSNIGAIVMECTNMSPFAADIRKKFGIPVFNIYTFIDSFDENKISF